MQLFIIVQSAKCCYTGKIFSLNLAAHKCLFLFNFNIFKVWRKQYMKIIVTSLWFPSAIFFKILNSHTTFLQSWNNAVNFPSPGIEIPIHPLYIDPRHIHLALGVQRWICAKCNPRDKINLYVIGFPTKLIFWKVIASVDSTSQHSNSRDLIGPGT